MSRMNQNELAKRREMERTYETISPFEFKNKLIDLAKGHQKKSTRMMLNAGRGNPNWIASTPRDAFFSLGRFALDECRRVWDEGDLAGKPARPGAHDRFRSFVQKHADMPGVPLLVDVVDYGIEKLGFDADAFVHELVDGIIGDNYPEPDRMLGRVERVVHEFLMQEMCQGDASAGRFDLFAVEGATAAMCYIFDTLNENYLLTRGDRIAIMVPIFPPYVEISQLARYDFDIVQIRASAVDAEGNHTWQYPDAELEKLADPSIKALFLVNPSNPPSVAMDEASMRKLVELVRDKNPNLMIVSDDVYGTFVDGFRSLISVLPYNTIGVYSFSKYFGVTGWRLGVVAVHEHNVFDHLLQALPQEKLDILDRRYASMTLHPRDVRFLDRMVADSRQVALNHTAGLSTPQQVQMALFAAFALLDEENRYKQLTKDICHRRMRLLYEGLDLPLPNIPNDADYYTEFDLEEWSNHHYGEAFTKFLQSNYEPVDILFRLAEESGIVLLNGAGFHGPTWSIRVSLANLDDQSYATIGRDLHAALEGYVNDWKSTHPQ
ncbi:aspartate 4-decarboxylase [Alicyclobacillus fastidiosus]|uniref:Aminotransferase n=1 Tax=Alicyclobacillus fastidiosus TaxID=392011 RepID=A0ABV5AD17_9BACL|nr:aspartate 4-decarboxylase [Alicyclobacillus fastidiosus]WEH08807.1 aspartate 4-decarboxylase [Alicyclobacillus fastidiosus]